MRMLLQFPLDRIGWKIIWKIIRVKNIFSYRFKKVYLLHLSLLPKYLSLTRTNQAFMSHVSIMATDTTAAGLRRAMLMWLVADLSASYVSFFDNGLLYH